ncbi:MAG: FKBP-type peptidyl-prolyl cis-trans isomerase SlyD [Gammaproteobacteria bacterium]|jgi:FKBP-type peptidyl-prolyl cis-trans isomerase SlyD
MTLLIDDNSVVSMHYTLTDDDGNVIDSSEGNEPLTYLQGAGNIIPGLEKAMVGKAEGDTLHVSVEPDEGYGEILGELIREVERSAFEGVDDIEIGMAFQAETENGMAQRVVIVAVDEENVTIDANHALAGKPLNFTVEVIAIRSASEEEIAHGHVH